MRRILTDKDLAKLGDAFINFVTSAALSLASGKAQGIKTPRKTLREAYKLSALTNIKLPHDWDPAESVEALLSYAWLNNCLSSEQAVEFLYKALTSGKALEVAIALLIDRALSACLSRG
ncbi:ribonuclease III family protein [Infirmifilum sp. NZ]|uniref:ribonuclease III family protein n=1 Tax=Infirmifilum sp. NZ TaxID=2926850 RepID=UPI003FA38B98